MIDSIFKLRYTTHGIYEWGKGYVSNDVAARCCKRRKMKHTMSKVLSLCVKNVISISASAGTIQNKKG